MRLLGIRYIRIESRDRRLHLVFCRLEVALHLHRLGYPQRQEQRIQLGFSVEQQEVVMIVGMVERLEAVIVACKEPVRVVVGFRGKLVEQQAEQNNELLVLAFDVLE